MRRRRIIALALALGLLGGACSSGADEPQARPGKDADRAPSPAVELQVTSAELVSDRRALGPLDDASRRQVMDVVQRTFEATVAGPVTTGEAGTITALFTADAAARAVGPDRGALFDEGLPAVRTLVADRADVQLTGLDGGGDGPALVVARIAWDVRSADSSVRVQRAGELSLVPAFGAWLVGSYSVMTARTVGGAVTTTTAVSG